VDPVLNHPTTNVAAHLAAVDYLIRAVADGFGVPPGALELLALRPGQSNLARWTRPTPTDWSGSVQIHTRRFEFELHHASVRLYRSIGALTRAEALASDAPEVTEAVDGYRRTVQLAARKAEIAQALASSRTAP
jgi:hypothetical protein